MREDQVLGMAKQILCEKIFKLISAFQFKKSCFFRRGICVCNLRTLHWCLFSVNLVARSVSKSYF
jgi:hypothetical protein